MTSTMPRNAHLIVDAGATKTNFLLVTDGIVAAHVKQPGINATYSEEQDIARIFSDTVRNFPSDISIKTVNYYGAGCARPLNALKISNILQLFFPLSDNHVHSDLLAACHALSGKAMSIVCILGTGAASCLFNGHEIVAQAPSLGFLLGDEGSGTHIGKCFLKKHLSHQLPKELSSSFEKKYALTETAIFEKLYQTGHPNKFMSSIVPFVKENLHFDILSDMVEEAFTFFFNNQKQHYDNAQDFVWNFTGSVAANFEPQLQRAAEATGCKTGKIVADPMPMLVKYHHCEIEEL